MPIETLSHLLMLSNLETSTEKLLQIVLIGQPEFENTLNRQELRQLKQRLVIHEKIDALTSQESLAYIHHRLDKVKTHTEPIFHHKAEALLIKASKGTPRVLNTLCTNALIAGVGYQEKPVSTRTVKQVTDNLLGTRRTSTGLHPWRYLFVALGILLLLCILWLSPIGKYITRPPMIPAARDMLLTRFKGFMPSWIQAKLPKSDPMVSPAPEPIAPPAPEPMAEPPEPIPPEPEPPVVSTSTQKPEDADPQPSTEQSDDPSRNGLQPEDIPEEPVDTEDNGFPLTISVSPGEDISDIALEIYGFANDELFDLIKQSNPNVEDLKSIKVGDKLLLPALPKALEKYRGT